MEFKNIGGALFLQIEPMYFFTDDGETACDGQMVGPYTTRIKAKERNLHVLNNIFFWADVLAQGQRQIEIALSGSGQTILVINRTPVSGIANFSIPDDPAVYEPVDEDMQMNFLDTVDIANEPIEEEEDEEFGEDD
jgi:hypothetical protein